MPSPLFSDSPEDMSPVQPLDLAARLAARLCHDFISPVSAIVSGLDLIEDPEQQDMREEAMSLIAAAYLEGRLPERAPAPRRRPGAGADLAP